MTVLIRSAYSKKYPVNLDFSDDEVSLTKQSFSKECDVNFIMSKYSKTGLIDHIQSNPGRFGDFLDIVDYQSSLNSVLEAQASFDALPSALRARFDNDPALFLSFVQDESNRDEAINLGLIERLLDPITPAPDAE